MVMHSTQSNNTTAITHIESASNHSSHYSHHTHTLTQQLQATNQIVTVNKMVKNNIPSLKTDIVIPMDEYNYIHYYHKCIHNIIIIHIHDIIINHLFIIVKR